MHYAIHSRSITRLANWLLLLLCCAVSTTLLAGQFATGIYVDQVSTNLALEIRAGYPIGSDKVLYSGLYNNGSDNVIEFKMLNASPTGVSIDQDLGDVDSGQIFGLGDWCFSGNYAVMPYIKDFDVHVLRYDLTNNSFDTMLVAPSQTAQYTSTDCMRFELGASIRLTIAVNNFDAKGIDYFDSEDDGANWNLGIEYRLDGGLNIIDAFAGGFRDTHDAATSDSIGATYQRNDGVVEAARITLVGAVLGTRTIADGSSLINNGHLKELDGNVVAEYCFGGANLGETISGAFVNTGNGDVGLGDQFDNPAGDNPVFGFSGMDITAREWPASPGLFNLYYQSNRLLGMQFDASNQQFSNAVQFSDFPFMGNGGPAEAFYADFGTVGRLLSFGVSNENLRDTAGFLGGTFVATIDPTTAVTEPVQPLMGLPGVAVPLLNRQMLLLMLLLIAAVGAITLARRSG